MTSDGPDPQDVRRCPKHLTDPEHYLPDGDCYCPAYDVYIHLRVHATNHDDALDAASSRIHEVGSLGILRNARIERVEQ